MDVPYSLMFKALSPAGKAVFGTVARLHAERSAGENPWRVDHNLVTTTLRQSFNRLRADRLDQDWWESLWNAIGHKAVSPDVLRRPAVQGWLRKGGVEQDLIDLATARVMQVTSRADQAAKDRLSEAYSAATGEARHLAEDGIDTVVAILAAGYIATIPQDQRAVFGAVQQVSQQMAGIKRQIGAIPVRDPVAERIHTQEAERALAVLLKRRLLGIEQPEKEFQALREKVVEDGEWAAASDASRLRIQYWAARVCAGSAETLEYARGLRRGLTNDEPDGLLIVVDAIITTTGGDLDKAIRSLREVDHPDARSAALTLLVRHKGRENGLAAFASVDPASDPGCFTDVGWKVWAVSLAMVGRWRDAVQGLRALAGNADWRTALAIVEGTLNAAMLTKDEARARVLDGPLAYEGIAPRLGEEAKQHHKRAVECFDHVRQAVAEFADAQLNSIVDQWCMWLRLMDPDLSQRTTAQAQIRDRMTDGADAVHLIFLAWGFRIEFDPTALREYLAYCERFGGLDDEQVTAEYLLGRLTLSPKDFAAYLERRKDRLERVRGVAETTTMLFGALIQDGQFDRAREVEASATSLPSKERARMRAALDSEAGQDMLGDLQAAYEATKSHVDLMNLVSHLQTSGNHEAARPHVRALFDDDPTVENARAVVGSLSRPEPDHSLIARFFDEHSDLAGQNRDLKVAQANALFHTGRLQEARGIIDALLDESPRQDALALDLNVTIATGDWDRLPVILQREMHWLDDLGVDALMRLAQIAADSPQGIDHALKLARLATEKAPDDPQVLAWAYTLHFQLGRDGEADPAWLSRGVEKSSAHDGPIWVKNLSQLVHEVLPDQRERGRWVRERLTAGQLPMVLAASALNVPLSRVLLEEPRIASESQDARRKSPLPIVSGAHDPIEVRDGWIVGLDLTTVLLLSRIGLLERVLNSGLEVRVPQEIMEWLFAERLGVRFHQPTRVQSAKRLRRLIDRRRIHIVGSPVQVPPSLVEEVGVARAELLETSRQEGGIAVCARPIHRAQSLAEDVADTSGYDNIIYTPADLCNAARAQGIVDSDRHERAIAFLEMQGKSEAAGLTPEALNGPIFVDQLALSYLQGADVLEALSDLDLRVHSNVAEEATAVIEAGDAGEALVRELEQIRMRLWRGVESGRLSFLPRATFDPDEPPPAEPAQRAVQALFGAAEVCDAVCADDRFLNAHGQVASPSGRSVPVLCVLDLLNYFRRNEVITAIDHWQALHQLRCGGFAWIPVEEEELSARLQEAVAEDGSLTETAELRAVRQSVNLLESRGFVSPPELPAVVGRLVLACLRSIRDLWEHSAIPAEQAIVLCDWIWRHLMASTLLPTTALDEDKAGNARGQMIAFRFALLLTPINADPPERRAAYAEWVTQSALATLQAANPDLLREALSTSLAMAQAHEQHRAFLGRMYFESLPQPLRVAAISMDPAFAQECGFEAASTIALVHGQHVSVQALLQATQSVYRTRRTESLEDLSGRELHVSIKGDGARAIPSVEWQATDGNNIRLDIPELGLFSPEPSTRREVLDGAMKWLGPTADIPVGLLQAAESREMTSGEVSDVLAEMSAGVASFKDRLSRRLTAGGGLRVADFAPHTMDYWTRLCGLPPDVLTGPDDYIREQLVPHRRELVGEDLRGGLEICFIGALSDGLLPGQWVDDVDNDTLWDALSGIQVKGNAIALLAALDVALYRVTDPRFRDFAADAMRDLLDDDLGLPADREVYRLFHLLCDLVSNALPTMEGLSATPGYWRRMCAWMQAGMITGMFVASGRSLEADAFADWCAENATFAGEARRMMDCRTEPMVFASQVGSKSLRYEIAVRTIALKVRHEAAGRKVPMAGNVAAVFGPLTTGEVRVTPVPGPCELHVPPQSTIPKGVEPPVEQGESDQMALNFLAGVCQFYRLRSVDMERCRRLVAQRPNGDKVDLTEALERAYTVSTIAAATRSASLADAVGDCMAWGGGNASEQRHVELIIRILLQAAAAHEGQQEWMRWLDARLSEVAEALPTRPRGLLALFVSYLEEIERVSPVTTWFHLRAKAVASAGVH